MHRKTIFATLTFAAACAALAACSGDDNTTSTPVPDSGTPDTSVSNLNDANSNNTPDTNSPAQDANNNTNEDANDNTPDSNVADSNTGGDGGCSGATPVALTVEDTQNWCTITIGSTGTPFSTGDQTVCVAAGSTTNLSASANGGFVIGPWHNTSSDGTNLDAGPGATSTTTITVGDAGTACAWICCPGPGGSNPPCTQTGCE